MDCAAEIRVADCCRSGLLLLQLRLRLRLGFRFRFCLRVWFWLQLRLQLPCLARSLRGVSPML